MGENNSNPTNGIPASAIPNETLEAYIQRLMGYVSRLRSNGELDIFTKLFQTDYRILSYLELNNDIHPSALAEVLNSTRPNIAANLRMLEAKGFVERAMDPKNRRQVFVHLTDKGKAYLAVCEKQLSFLFAGWFTILRPEEIGHLFKILDLSTDPKVVSAKLKHFNFGN